MSDERLVESLKKICEQFDIIISLLARQVLDPEKIKNDIAKGSKDKDRIVRCFNLCDGKTPLTKIAKKGGIDQGGLSRQVDSWEKDGYVIKIRDGANVYPKALIQLR